MIGQMVAAFLAMSALASAQDENYIDKIYVDEIFVRIEQRVALASKTLEQAKALAAQIFARSGIRVRFVDVHTQGTGDPFSRPIPVLILDRRPPNIYDDVTGFSVLAPLHPAESYAAVVLSSAGAVANREDFPLTTIVGATIAHEIGHVLLGASHSLGGVMSARLARPELRMAQSGTLLFLAEESNRLREAIRLRTP